MKDSDGGKNIYVAGTVSGYDKDGNPRKADDYCSSKTQVAELTALAVRHRRAGLIVRTATRAMMVRARNPKNHSHQQCAKILTTVSLLYVYGKLYYQPKGEDTGKSVADYCVGRTKVQEFYCTGTDGTVPHYYWFDCTGAGLYLQ